MMPVSDMPVWLARAINLFDEGAHNDGDVLSHDWIRYALDIPEPRSVDDMQELQWLMLTRMDALRDWLLVERKIALQNVRGKGYRIVPPAEQARHAVEEAMTLVRKGLKKGDKLMTNTRTNELSVQDKQRHTDAHLRLCGINDMMRRQRRDVFRLFSPDKKVS